MSINNISYKTVPAVAQTVEEGIDTNVFIVRDEKNIGFSNEKRIIVSMVNNGERVAAGEIIGAEFSTTQQADNFKKYLYYKKDLERLEALVSREKINISDIKSYDSETNNLFKDYIDCIRKNNFYNASQKMNEYCDKVTSRQTALGKDVDLKKSINEINTQINSLKITDPKYIYSDSTGYFVDGIDGCENLIDYENVKNVNVQQIDTALSTESKNSSSNSGKIINNFNWYMVCHVTMKDVQDLNVGDEIRVRFLNANLEEKVEISAVNTENKKDVALVLRCNNITSKVFPLRNENVKIITKKISGYKIDKQALRTVGGYTGVYIVRGNIISFRYVDIIYTSDDYVIVRSHEDKSSIIAQSNEKIIEEKRRATSQKAQRSQEEAGEIIDSESVKGENFNLEKYIRLYDEVIVKGSDLVDGKLIQ